MDLLVADVPDADGADTHVPDADPARNLALEEALVRAVPPVPLLRIWQNEACVVIGRAQHPGREADLAACAAGGIPVLRRASGGGAVYHDQGNLNITVVVPGRVPGLAGDVAALVGGVLRRLGVAPAVTERGVFAGAAKVSGLAAHVTRAATLAHATLLVTTPGGRVRTFLAPAPPDARPSDSRRSPVVPLSDLIPGLNVPAARVLVCEEAAGRYGPLVPRPASAGELDWQRRLLAQRYSRAEWHATGRVAPAADSTLTCTT